jgi:hypothetical protein
MEDPFLVYATVEVLRLRHRSRVRLNPQLARRHALVAGYGGDAWIGTECSEPTLWCPMHSLERTCTHLRPARYAGDKMTGGKT